MIKILSRFIKDMHGSPDAKAHEEYIARVEEIRRDDIQRLHDLVRQVAPEQLIRDTAAASWGQ